MADSLSGAKIREVPLREPGSQMVISSKDHFSIQNAPPSSVPWPWFHVFHFPCEESVVSIKGVLLSGCFGISRRHLFLIARKRNFIRISSLPFWWRKYTEQVFPSPLGIRQLLRRCLPMGHYSLSKGTLHFPDKLLLGGQVDHTCSTSEGRQKIKLSALFAFLFESV